MVSTVPARLRILEKYNLQCKRGKPQVWDHLSQPFPNARVSAFASAITKLPLGNRTGFPSKDPSGILLPTRVEPLFDPLAPLDILGGSFSSACSVVHANPCRGFGSEVEAATFVGWRNPSSFRASGEQR